MLKYFLMLTQAVKTLGETMLVSNYSDNPNYENMLMFTEEGILRDTEKAEEAIKRGDAPGIVSATSNIARRANRVLQMAQQEADNSEDPRFVEHVNEAVRNLRASK